QCGRPRWRAQVAPGVVALTHRTRHLPGLDRFFQAAAWLWSGIFLLITVGMGALMVPEPVKMFMVGATVVTVALIVAGIAISALWVRSVLRRFGLRVRFPAG